MRSTWWAFHASRLERTTTRPLRALLGCSAEHATIVACCRSRQQNARSRGVAAFEIAMRLLRVLQRIFLVHRDLDHAARHHVKKVVRDHEQVFALGRVGIERRGGWRTATLWSAEC